MWTAAANVGLRELLARRLYRSAARHARGSSQCRHYVASSALLSAADVPTNTTPEAAAAAVAAKRTGRAVYWFVGVAAAAVLGTLAYPMVVTLPVPPQQTTPSTPPPTVPPPTGGPPAAAVQAPLSPREELTKRVEVLKAELTQLRKQERSQLVDMKKRAIKDEIAMIQSGLKKLDKA